jgi:hypothetical protein
LRRHGFRRHGFFRHGLRSRAVGSARGGKSLPLTCGRSLSLLNLQFFNCLHKRKISNFKNTDSSKLQAKRISSRAQRDIHLAIRESLLLAKKKRLFYGCYQKFSNQKYERKFFIQAERQFQVIQHSRTDELHSESRTQLKSNHGLETDLQRMIGRNWGVWGKQE